MPTAVSLACSQLDEVESAHRKPLVALVVSLPVQRSTRSLFQCALVLSSSRSPSRTPLRTRALFHRARAMPLIAICGLGKARIGDLALFHIKRTVHTRRTRMWATSGTAGHVPVSMAHSHVTSHRHASIFRRAAVSAATLAMVASRIQIRETGAVRTSRRRTTTHAFARTTVV